MRGIRSVPYKHVEPHHLFRYARAFHDAAKALAATLPSHPDLLDYARLSPVLFLYRHALELQLKSMVRNYSGIFLPEEPDRISVSQSHAITWLGQIVCQTVKTLAQRSETRPGFVGFVAQSGRCARAAGEHR